MLYTIYCKCFIYSYWCVYGPKCKIIIMSASSDQKEKHNRHESIKVGCQCHFIVRQLQLRWDDVVIIYTTCRHIDKSTVACHGKDAISRPMRFSHAPHWTRDMQYIVKHFIQIGFNVTMIWDKFISDVNDGLGELYTGTSRDTYMTRQVILNIYNDTIRLEYVKYQSNSINVECWYKEHADSFFF